MSRPGSRGALVTAAVIVVALQKLPFGRWALYPFTLLATWVHEMGHGVAALLVGGRFERLEIFGDASGLAHSSVIPGWRNAFVAAGGLLGPPLAGALVLAFSRGPRRARVLLALLALSLVASLVVWVRTTVGWASLGPLALLFALIAWRTVEEIRLVTAQLVGVLFALDTVTGIDYLFTATAHVAGQDRPSDIATFANAVGGPWIVWGSLLAALSFALLIVGLWLAWRRGKP